MKFSPLLAPVFINMTTSGATDKHFDKIIFILQLDYVFSSVTPIHWTENVFILMKFHHFLHRKLLTWQLLVSLETFRQNDDNSVYFLLQTHHHAFRNLHPVHPAHRACADLGRRRTNAKLRQHPGRGNRLGYPYRPFAEHRPRRHGVQPDENNTLVQVRRQPHTRLCGIRAHNGKNRYNTV